MERSPRHSGPALVVLATLAVIAALYFLKTFVVSITLALLLACLLSPVTKLLRRILPIGPTGSAVVLFLLTVMVGLYAASLTAESLVQAAHTLPIEIERLAGQVSNRVTQTIRDQPYLRGVLPEPGTIDQVGDANRAMVIDTLSYGFSDLMIGVGWGLVILVLVLFLLAESEMLTPKLIRFFAATPGDVQAASRALDDLTRQVRAYLVARTLINLGLGLVMGLVLWGLGVKYPFALGMFAGVTNFVPYVGQVLGGGLPTLMALGQTGGVGDALIVASAYLAVVGFEGYVVTPYVMGRSLDLNGTTVLVTCLFWGFLWGLVGLVLAMPITVCFKLVCQTIPELHRWAELMSRDWQTPAHLPSITAPLPDPPPPDGPGPPGPALDDSAASPRPRQRAAVQRD